VDSFQVEMLISGVVALLLGLSGLARSLGIARLLHVVTPDDAGEPAVWPPVSVLAPCRGVDAHFEAYARALLTQEYSPYEVLFLLESSADPAWEVLRRIVAENPGARATLMATGLAESCSQKVHNLLVGLDHVAPQTAVLAFVDSDAQVHPGWLKALVAPLQEATIGATSGFRWYVPCPGDMAGGLRSAWNAATLGLMVHRRFGFAWGGSSAIRRDLFEKLGIRDLWLHGLSDDLLLTQALRRAGLAIQFVPACLVPTFEPCTWRQLIEWTNRQVTIGRVYVPHSWGISLLVHSTSLILAALGLAAIAHGQWLASGLLLSYWLVGGIGNAAVCRAARQQLEAHGFAVAQRAWPQALWAPGVTALALVNLAASLTTRTITWRGISYTMRSAQQVVVHRRAYLSATSSPPS
jgi:ceramide glucosyltransferase